MPLSDHTVIALRALKAKEREAQIRSADCWRRGEFTQYAGDTEARQHKSINIAKKFMRGRKCVVLRDGEYSIGQYRFGLFFFFFSQEKHDGIPSGNLAGEARHASD